MRAFTSLIAVALFAVPAVAFGAETLRDFINIITEIVFLTVPFAAALLFFFWNLYQLIATVGDPEKKKQARTRLLWSIIAMFILFSLAGLVAMLQYTFFGATTAETGQVQDLGFTPPPSVGAGQQGSQTSQGSQGSQGLRPPQGQQGSATTDCSVITDANVDQCTNNCNLYPDPQSHCVEVMNGDPAAFCNPLGWCEIRAGGDFNI